MRSFAEHLKDKLGRCTRTGTRHLQLCFFQCSVKKSDVEVLQHELLEGRMSGKSAQQQIVIKEMEFAYCFFEEQGDSIKLLKECLLYMPGLQGLSFKDVNVDNGTLASLLEASSAVRTRIRSSSAENALEFFLAGSRVKDMSISLDGASCRFQTPSLGSRLAELESLTLKDWKFADESDFEALLKELGKLPKLKSLWIERLQGVSHRAAVHFAGLCQSPTLVDLTLWQVNNVFENMDRRTARTLAHSLERNTSLRRLHLWGTTIDSYLLCLLLKALENNQCLQSVRLQRVTFCEASLRQLVRSLPKMRHLDKLFVWDPAATLHHTASDILLNHHDANLMNTNSRPLSQQAESSSSSWTSDLFQALQQNASLTKFEAHTKHGRLGTSNSPALASLHRRNKYFRQTKRLMASGDGSDAVWSHALAKIGEDPGTATATFHVLQNRAAKWIRNCQ